MTDFRARAYEVYLTSGAASAADSAFDSRRPYLSMIVNRFFPVDKTERICDLGCGHGALMKVAKDAGYSRIEGVDASVEQVSAARKIGDGLEVICGDLLEYLEQQDSESVAMIITLDVIEHLDKSELLNMCGEIFRVLKKGGSWLSHQPNGNSPYHGRVRYGDYTHVQAYTPSSMGQLASLSGFSSNISFDDPPIVHGVKSGFRRAVWNIFKFTRQLELFAETGAWEGVMTQNFFSVSVK